MVPVALAKTEIIPLQTNPEMSPGAKKLQQSLYICFMEQLPPSSRLLTYSMQKREALTLISN